MTLKRLYIRNKLPKKKKKPLISQGVINLNFSFFRWTKLKYLASFLVIYFGYQKSKTLHTHTQPKKKKKKELTLHFILIDYNFPDSNLEPVQKLINKLPHEQKSYIYIYIYIHTHTHKA